MGLFSNVRVVALLAVLAAACSLDSGVTPDAPDGGAPPLPDGGADATPDGGAPLPDGGADAGSTEPAPGVDASMDAGADAAPQGNVAPVISGDAGFALVDVRYEFSPTSSDADGDPLTFAIDGLPSWASFDTATGTLSGTPGIADLALVEDITITVSDGVDSADLVFDLAVAESNLEAALATCNHTFETSEAVYFEALRQTIADGIASGDLPAETTDVSEFLTRLEDDTFTFAMGICVGTTCPKTITYNTEFRNIARDLRNHIDALDESATIICDGSSNHRYERLLVLLADHLRPGIRFPLHRTLDRHAFLKALFADHIVYHFRDHNPAQIDLGNFSRSDFSHVVPESATVLLDSRGPFRAAGVYAMPGRTVRVTRNDRGDVDTWIRVGTVRENAVRQFDNNGYNRPKYTASAWMPVASGETISFTSPYGGPVQVRFSGNDVATSFSVDGIGRHPFWNRPEDTDAFLAAIVADDFDWAEFVTPHFELHTPTRKMATTLAVPGIDDPQGLHDVIVGLFINFAYQMAGLQADDIDSVAEIEAFATARGIVLPSVDYVQHVNADQASCSTACGGNPYDSNASFNPFLPSIHMHELGHSLEMRPAFTGWRIHSQTDLYQAYSIYRANEGGLAPEGSTLSCGERNFEGLFDLLQESVGQADPFAFMQAQDLEDWRNSLAIHFQLLALAENAGSLTSGWYLHSHIHTLRRAFDAAVEDDALWAAQAATLGFGTFTRAEAAALSRDDWSLIAMSQAMQLDLVDYLTMWGIELTDAARAQVRAFGLSTAPRVFYALKGQDHCSDFGQPALPIDGTTNWPP